MGGDQAQEIEEQTKLLHQENASYDAIKEQLGDLRSKMDGGTREVTELKQKVRDIEQQMADKQGTKDDLLSKIDQCDKMTSHYQRKIQTIASMLDALSVSWRECGAFCLTQQQQNKTVMRVICPCRKNERRHWTS